MASVVFTEPAEYDLLDIEYYIFVDLCNPQAAQRISSLANAYGGDENSLADINLISQTVKNAAKISTLYYGAEFVSADSPISEGIKSFSKEEAELFQTIINKRLNKIQPQLINSTILMPTR